VPPDRAQGVFETMLVRGRRVSAMARHLHRLSHSVAALYGTELPADLCARVIAQAAGLEGEHRLRVDVIPGEDASITTAPVAAGSRTPVTLEPLVVPGGLGAHKWRDRRLLDVVARDRDTTSPRAAGLPSPLLIDSDETVLEAGWGNVWLIEGGQRLVTPPTDGRILPGVTRALLLQLAPSLGLRPSQETISLERLRAAPVTFATSAIRLAVPATLGGSPAAPAPIVDRIRTALTAL
jgi:para-aminobenzoate synthetase/4-amino-4-deoxychorismate lyase